jgi:hypothetical protein
MPDMMKPSPTLLVKLGSIIVHFDEATELGGHKFDIQTARQLLNDPDVSEWIKQMNGAAMLPVKRSVPPRKS